MSRIRLLLCTSAVALMLVAGCSDDSSSGDDPGSSSDSTSEQLNVTCTDFDQLAQQCNVVQVVRIGSQGDIEYQATINVGQPTLDLSAVETTINNSANLDRLQADINNPAVNVSLDKEAQSVLTISTVNEGFESIIKLHPDQCRLVRVRNLELPICV